ncbi:MAG: acetyl-CoA acetyltransferase [Candidatus Binatus sp.]|jgi:acetyl-CoA C-acetyltransferase|uniref:acetyl-CoA acetyltransferase n=1 Tax=Candidatus Binatus sp. TaxID=2811406 RepID=UPI003C788A4F
MTKPAPVYVLGGAQTDFARNWTKEGKHFVAMMREATLAALEATRIEPREVETAHVGNFAAELYAKQGHIGAFFVEVDPAFSGLPTSRHEAACASGSIALIAASAEIEAARYDLACVVGVEQMKTVDSTTGGDYLGTAAWYEREAKGIEFPFPKLFGRLGDEYDKRYGLKDEHLAHISAVNYSNAKRNPNAQTRNWFMSESHAQHESKFNQVIGGRIKVSDCSQVTDGSVAVFLASEKFASAWAKRNGKTLADIPRILGWGHHTAPLEFDTKVAESRDNAYVLPHTRQAILDAFKRAEIGTVAELSGIETHDCFTTSEYMAIDHFGITKPGESWKAVEEGVIELGGKLPINPSGGLIGAGHPVGATGVRQMLDCHRQITHSAGDYQVEGAKKFAMLNIGGSGTTSCVFIVGK